MPVLHLHFQANTNAYLSDTEKVLGVAAMMAGDTLDWFCKATAEDVELYIDYSRFEAKLMSTGNNQDIRYYTLNSLLEIQQGNCPIQAYIDKFLKLKTFTQLEDELATIIFRKGVNLAMKDLLKHHPPTLILKELLPLCKGLSLNQEDQNLYPSPAGRAATVTKVKVSRPQAGIEPAPSHQAGLTGRGDLPEPGFLLLEVNPGAGVIPALLAAEGPVLGPKSYTQAFVGLARPGQAIFSCPVNPDQTHPPLSNLGSPIRDPFFNQAPWAQESLSSQSKNIDQIGKTPITPEAKPARTNSQPSQDGSPKSQTTVPENPKNDHEAANQSAESEMPSLAIQIAPEECPEAPVCQ
ncbi:hypothetical protein DSO57_1030723 [Entomophthora muscae]|uniref:Uncharacterized protein n=1 Tax=Entomophthora muscae TaxID=34485 RepID=A0ACC2ULN2_9FUNG|nr:hypothetical protein DSO57_1030723 [Entomophthora muscae]